MLSLGGTLFLFLFLLGMYAHMLNLAWLQLKMDKIETQGLFVKPFIENKCCCIYIYTFDNDIDSFRLISTLLLRISVCKTDDTISNI